MAFDFSNCFTFLKCKILKHKVQYNNKHTYTTTFCKQDYDKYLDTMEVCLFLRLDFSKFPFELVSKHFFLQLNAKLNYWVRALTASFAAFARSLIQNHLTLRHGCFYFGQIQTTPLRSISGNITRSQA